MEDLTLEILARIAFQESFSNPYYRKIEKLVEELRTLQLLGALEQEEHIFYPKKVFLEKETLEMFFISKENIIISSIDDTGIISFRNIPLSVNELELKINSGVRTVELFVHNLNGEVFTFSNISDTNSHWKSAFYTGIFDIYKFLS